MTSLMYRRDIRLGGSGSSPSRGFRRDGIGVSINRCRASRNARVPNVAPGSIASGRSARLAATARVCREDCRPGVVALMCRK